MISVEIIYATPIQQWKQTITLTDSSTIEQAIRASKLLEDFPDIELSSTQVGIFSKRVSLSSTLKSGDRVEIYRPLKIDPKQARRVRAKTKPIR